MSASGFPKEIALRFNTGPLSIGFLIRFLSLGPPSSVSVLVSHCTDLLAFFKANDPWPLSEGANFSADSFPREALDETLGDIDMVLEFPTSSGEINAESFDDLERFLSFGTLSNSDNEENRLEVGFDASLVTAVARETAWNANRRACFTMSPMRVFVSILTSANEINASFSEKIAVRGKYGAKR
jgi:hypothetical protein